MPKPIQISNLNSLQFSSWTKVKYDNKKVCSGWGSRTFYHQDKNGNLYCKKFNFLQRIAHNFGYQSHYTGNTLYNHLKDRNILLNAPRNGRMDKLIACSLTALKKKWSDPKDFYRSEFIRQINDPTVTDTTLINFLKTHPDIDLHCKTNGFTFAFSAAKSQRLTLLKHLVREGVDINERCEGTNEVAITPLHMALDKNDLDMCQYLIDNGADVNAQNTEGDTPAHLLLEMIARQKTAPYGANLRFHVDDMTTRKVPQQVFEKLLNKKPNLDIVNNKQETVLFKAIRLQLNAEFRFMIDHHKADVLFVNRNGDNILTFIAEFGNEEMMNILNDFKIDIPTIERSRNVILLAIENPNLGLDAIRNLINAGATIENPEILIKGIKRKNHRIVGFLITLGANINASGAFVEAIKTNKPQIMNEFIPEVNKETLLREGDEALIEAIENKNISSAVQILKRYEKEFQPSKMPSEKVFQAANKSPRKIKKMFEGYKKHITGSK